MPEKNLIIVGAGGFASEVYHYAKHCGYKILGFVDETLPSDGIFMKHKVYNSLKKVSSFYAEYCLAIGDPKTRAKYYIKCDNLKMKPSAHIFIPSFQGDAVVGHLYIGAPNVVITNNVHIGHGVILNIGATVGHDSVIGDFTTVSPGANISGKVKIGSFCYIGTNACIREGVEIPDNTVIGMGAVVIKSIKEPGVYVGCPAVKMGDV